MSSLNHSLPAAWQAVDGLDVMQVLSIYIPFISGSRIRSSKNSNAVSMLSNLYAQTNGTASFNQIAKLLDTTVGNVEELASAIGQTSNSSINAQSLQRTVLWGDANLSKLPNYTPEVGYLALGIIFMGITIITTALRLYQRSRAPIGLQPVDYALVMALAIALAMEGLFGTFVETLVLKKTGAIWFITYDIFVRLQIIATTLVIIYHPCILFLKSSILIFYAQMGLTPTRNYQLCIIYSVLAVCVASNIIGFFVAIFQYRPVDYWNHEFNSNPWAPRNKVLFAVGIINMVTDVIIWIMPIPTIIKLGQTWWARIIAMALIFSSAAACVFSALRVRLVFLGALATKTGSLADFDTTTFAMLEINLAIITYNMPAIRVLYTNYVRKRRERAHENSFHVVERGIVGGRGALQLQQVESSSNNGSTLKTKTSNSTDHKETGKSGHAEIDKAE